MNFEQVLPQIITAAATLAGVVLTLIFTGRREDRRTKQTLAFEREKLLADDRRQLFVRAAHQLQRTREVLQDETEIEVEYGPQAYEDAVTLAVDRLFEIETECLLIAPGLSESLRGAANIARRFRDESPKLIRTNRELWIADYRTHTRIAMGEMRSALGLPARVVDSNGEVIG